MKILTCPDNCKMVIEDHKHVSKDESVIITGNDTLEVNFEVSKEIQDQIESNKAASKKNSDDIDKIRDKVGKNTIDIIDLTEQTNKNTEDLTVLNSRFAHKVRFEDNGDGTYKTIYDDKVLYASTPYDDNEAGVPIQEYLNKDYPSSEVGTDGTIYLQPLIRDIDGVKTIVQFIATKDKVTIEKNDSMPIDLLNRIGELEKSDNIQNQSIEKLEIDFLNHLKQKAWTILTGNVDLNKITKDGKYFLQTNATKLNAPRSGWAYLYVSNPMGDSSRILQEYFYDIANDNYSRVYRKEQDKWTDWSKTVNTPLPTPIEYADQIRFEKSAEDTYKVIVNGKNVSENATLTNATNPQKSFEGYLNADIPAINFEGSYIASSNEINGVTQIMYILSSNSIFFVNSNFVGAVVSTNGSLNVTTSPLGIVDLKVNPSSLPHPTAHSARVVLVSTGKYDIYYDGVKTFSGVTGTSKNLYYMSANTLGQDMPAFKQNDGTIIISPVMYSTSGVLGGDYIASWTINNTSITEKYAKMTLI
ncbi:hypothetical protein BG262_02905 [Floricoccus penangensis]|uniref:Uncharacterized protein n=1 Tax=Floricoccus penangensis TaxID=1859475 RepID=A0A9Q5P0T6_9LACT|nr:pyocin knob domain-containing protein [Floricoccus penangensis]OFI46764.1 hypothetical protein BG262_02905 [Floricoccus penangensis]